MIAPNAREEAYDRAAKALKRWEEQILPTYGGRPWKVQVRVQDPLPTETKAAQKYPYFRFYKGVLELAAWPHIVEKIPEPPRFPGFSNSSSVSRKSSSNKDETVDECSSDEEESLSDEDKIIQMLQERETSVISEMALQERWRVPFPRISTKWVSPLREIFNSRKSAWDRAVELCKQEITIDKALIGVGGNGKPLKLKSLSRKSVMDAGRLRFERDGLWVVGQEEDWQRDRPLLENTESAPLPSSQNRRITGLAYFLQCKRKEHRDARLKELARKTFPVVNAQVKSQHQTILSGSNCNRDDSACDEQRVDGDNTMTATSEKTMLINARTREEDRITTHDLDKPANISDSEDTGNAVTSSSEATSNETLSPKLVDDSTRGKVSFTLREAENELRSIWKRMPELEKKDWGSRAKNVSEMPNDSENTSLSENAQLAVSSPSSIPAEKDVDAMSAAPTKKIVTPSCSHNSTQASPCKAREGRTEISVDGHSKKLCLDADQIKLCHDACVDHYEQVMRTVRVRDLVRELQGGFDLFRERGRGRFDMELPQFDTREFNFLTDLKKAPWMPVVKEILGKDVCLIHKGIFLAMPGAEKQNYHQDGVHLTSQYQKPCHAINVFVPLVDLTNQGTEFCLGSHILGNEDLDNDFLYTPSVAAGTPIVFDYRLGHRGLANTSNAIRPVVYCTYAAAADGNEFRDSVNFSRKRYKPIGDLVHQAPSREERARKRGKIVNADVADPTELSAVELAGDNTPVSSK